MTLLFALRVGQVQNVGVNMFQQKNSPLVLNRRIEELLFSRGYFSKWTPNSHLLVKDYATKLVLFKWYYHHIGEIRYCL